MGGRSRALLTMALAAALLAGAAPAAAGSPAAETSAGSAAPAAGARAAAPRARVRVLTRSRRKLARRGRLRVVVRYRGVGRVRLLARVRVPSKRKRLRRFTRARTLSFRAPGRRRAALRLTRYGRRLVRSRLRACVILRVSVLARAAGTRRTRRRLRVRPARKSLCRPVGPSNFRAGAASADITPPVGTPMFAYTARSALAEPPKLLQILADPDENLYAKSFVPSEGIHTRVRARALVFEQGGRKYALVQADLGGLPFALTQEVLRRVSGLGISGERLLLSATHTHSSTGPIWPLDSTGYALLGGDVFDPRAFALTAEGIAEAIRTADSRLEPARLGSAVVQVRGASRNRSFAAFRRNPDVPADEEGARAVSIDPELTVIRVDASDGSPIAAWSNFAVHPTSFGDDNLLFSGDNVATAERVAERGIAAQAAEGGHPAPPGRPPVNVWTNASEGDISPDGGPDRDGDDPLQYVPNSFASANLAGARIGEAVVRAWHRAGASLSGTLAIDARRSFLAFDGTPADGEPVGPLLALGFGGIVGPDGFCAPVDGLAGPGQGLKFPLLAGVGLVPSVHPVSMWRVGRLGLLGLPAEITKQMGGRIRERLAAAAGGALDRVALVGLTGGYASYTATPEEYDACRYEGSFTLFGRRQGARWLAGGREALLALLAGRPAQGSGEPLPLGLAVDSPGLVDATPDAGQVVAQPPATVRRFERASFSWRAGDPAVDAARGRALVTLEHLEGGSWRSVGTDDSERDITVLEGGAWTETWQFAECDPLGSYRFHVRGLADRGGGVALYELTSPPFELQPTAPLSPGAPAVAGGVASVSATYPDPGPDALLALPRRVRSGSARLRVNGNEVLAGPDAGRLRFSAPAPPGASVEVLGVEDACGNSS